MEDMLAYIRLSVPVYSAVSVGQTIEDTGIYTTSNSLINLTMPPLPVMYKATRMMESTSLFEKHDVPSRQSFGNKII